MATEWGKNCLTCDFGYTHYEHDTPVVYCTYAKNDRRQNFGPCEHFKWKESLDPLMNRKDTHDTQQEEIDKSEDNRNGNKALTFFQNEKPHNVIFECPVCGHRTFREIYRELEILYNYFKNLAHRVSERVKFYAPLILFLFLIVVAVSYNSYIINFINQFFGYIIVFILISLYLVGKYSDKYLEKKKKEEEKRKHEEWFKNIEPIHRNLKGRPPIDDWAIRRKEVYNRAGGKCAVCGIQNNKFHVHHKKPVSQGGNHSFENLELLCETCHAKEHLITGDKNAAILILKNRYGSKNNNEVWTVKRARRERDCVFCSGLIEEGEQYYGGKSCTICMQCYDMP